MTREHSILSMVYQIHCNHIFIHTTHHSNEHSFMNIDLNMGQDYLQKQRGDFILKFNGSESMSIQGGTSRLLYFWSTKVQRSTKKYGEVPKKYKEVQRSTEKYREVQRSTKEVHFIRSIFIRKQDGNALLLRNVKDLIPNNRTKVLYILKKQNKSALHFWMNRTKVLHILEKQNKSALHFGKTEQKCSTF